MTLSRRPRARAPLPTAASVLTAAAAGRCLIDGQALRLDAAARRLLGLTATRLTLQAWLAELPVPEAQALRAALAACRPHAPSFALTLRVQERTLLLRARLQSGVVHGLLIETVATAVDPTPSQRARDAFFAAVSHELRTPLNAILGFGRLARADLPSGADRRHLDHIDQAARLMLRVVNDVLDLAKLEAGKLEIEHDLPLSLPALVTRVGTVAAGLRQDKPIRLYAIVDPACPAHLRGDAGRIEQVLLNLTANALKFTDRGQVVVGVQLRAQQGRQVTLRVSVSDTGIGMALDDLQRMGRPFEQADDPARRGAAGSGLGLSVVRQLLELHGTRLNMASVPAGGTICWFDLELPLDSTAASEQLSAQTALFTADTRLAATVATQWRLHGQSLVPVEAAAQARRWVVDLAAPQARAVIQLARQQGRELVLVSADPVPESGELLDVLPLPMLANTVFHTDADDALHTDPQVLGLRVLIVEDNPLNQLVLREFLHRLGAQMVIVGDGPAALQKVAEQAFDVVLMDIQLPGANGIDTVRDMRKLAGGARLPIIFLSAHFDDGDGMAAAALGALACLTKPYDPQQLQALLRQLPRPKRGTGKPNAEPGAGRAASEPAPRSALRVMFAQQWPAQRAAIEHAADAQVLCRAVHALRGSLAVLGDAQAVGLARRVEEGLLAGQPADALAVAALLHSADSLAGA